MKIRTYLKALLVALIFTTVSVAGGSAEDALKKVVFTPQWLPQAQFAGYYVARELGIYKKYGLDVTILKGGPDQPSVKMLETKKTDFATLSLLTAIEKRASGLDIVNILQTSRRSALMFVAKKKSGILKPADMNGKKIGYWRTDFQGIPQAFFKKYGIKAQIFPMSFTISLFMEDGIDVMSAMSYNEYHKLLDAGLTEDELTTFSFYEHGLNFPEDGIYCNAEMLAKDPALCESFARASIEGWAYAFANQEKAVKIVLNYMKQAHVGANIADQQWMLNKMSELIMPSGENDSLIGELEAQDYERSANMLLESGVIKSVPDFKSFYKSCVKHVQK